MAKESIVEKVLNESTLMVGKVMEHLHKEFKNVRPVLKQTQPDDAIWAVNNLGYDDMNDLITEFGEDEINKILYQVHKWETDKRRGIKNA